MWPWKKSERPTDNVNRYQRKEEASIRAFYKPYAPYYSEPPAEVKSLVSGLAARTGLPANSQDYPVTRESFEQAAKALEACSRDTLAFPIDVRDQDPTQLDRMIETHLLSPELRPVFNKGRLKEKLSKAEEESYFAAREKLQVPREPVLYYCLGAWWGEWLVRHRQAVWSTYGPLNPVQSFPDMITALATLCIHPFSQVNKKFSDPEGDNLAFKAHIATTQRRELPPFPLLVSLVDSDFAARSLLPPKAREALDVQSTDGRAAFQLYCEAAQEDPDNLQLLALASLHACRGRAFGVAEEWIRAILAKHPEHAMMRHNLALICLEDANRQAEGMEILEKVAHDEPAYARARITLASCLRDVGRVEEAVTHLKWVIDNDQSLAEEARQFLTKIT